ncbi:hypothetical protein [Shewanella marina]|uniref:hypothetical protein n=1 Tax=Shewanella marina TaxID=487319 RepID=UPI000B330583|nr:hypothetical protein [Shewanella marina]
MAGIIPQGTASFGDPIKTNEVYQQNEVLPKALEIIEYVCADREIVKFGKLSLSTF